jgi:transposase
VDQRLQFLSSYQKEEMSVTDLCHEYGVSRPTAYKWIKRYNELGPEGLLDVAFPNGTVTCYLLVAKM